MHFLEYSIIFEKFQNIKELNDSHLRPSSFWPSADAELSIFAHPGGFRTSERLVDDSAKGLLDASLQSSNSPKDSRRLFHPCVRFEPPIVSPSVSASISLKNPPTGGECQKSSPKIIVILFYYLVSLPINRCSFGSLSLPPSRSVTKPFLIFLFLPS